MSDYSRARMDALAADALLVDNQLRQATGAIAAAQAAQPVPAAPFPHGLPGHPAMISRAQAATQPQAALRYAIDELRDGQKLADVLDALVEADAQRIVMLMSVSRTPATASLAYLAAVHERVGRAFKLMADAGKRAPRAMADCEDMGSAT